MIGRGQIFVRGRAPSGRWVNVDVLDLSDEDFRRFVMDVLMRAGAVVGFIDDTPKEPYAAPASYDAEEEDQ